jgi:hypothetical protein
MFGTLHIYAEMCQKIERNPRNYESAGEYICNRAHVKNPGELEKRDMNFVETLYKAAGHKSLGLFQYVPST